MPLSLTPDTQSPQSRSLPFSADATLGAIEIGVLVSTCLFGLVTAQAYAYLYRFPKDPLLLRVLVPFVWLLELGHTICICHVLYTVTVSQYGQPELLDIPPQSLNVAILLSGFIGLIEQGWFAHRIYKFSKKKYLPIFCCFLALVRFIGSIAISVVAFHRLTLEEYTTHWSWLLTTIVIVGASTDVILASTLCYYLSRWRESGFERTRKLVDRLILWTIETGLLTSVGAVALLVSFLTMRDNFVWIGIFSILARLFSNSFLASLNARPTLAEFYRQDMVRVSDNESLPFSPISAVSYPVLEMRDVAVTKSRQTSEPLNVPKFPLPSGQTLCKADKSGREGDSGSNI